MATTNGSSQPDVDVVVVGAGFAGLYMLHRLRQLGFSATVLESADDVGGTWYWNRYPGARCDIPTTDYSYSFDRRAGDRAGRGRRSTPPSRRSCATSSTSPTSTTCGGTSASRPASRRRRGTTAPSLWRLTTDRGDEHIACRYYVMASGCLSMPKAPDIEGAERFAGRGLLHEPLAARGRRLHRQAGRRHRHRLVGHPVDPADRRAGRRADRLPAHAELLAAGPQRSAAGRAQGRARPGSRRLPGGRPLVPRWRPGRGAAGDRAGQLSPDEQRARFERPGRPASCSPSSARSPTC